MPPLLTLQAIIWVLQIGIASALPPTTPQTTAQQKVLLQWMLLLSCFCTLILCQQGGY
jgi:hypothetical protein